MLKTIKFQTMGLALIAGNCLIFFFTSRSMVMGMTTTEHYLVHERVLKGTAKDEKETMIALDVAFGKNHFIPIQVYPEFGRHEKGHKKGHSKRVFGKSTVNSPPRQKNGGFIRGANPRIPQSKYFDTRGALRGEKSHKKSTSRKMHKQWTTKPKHNKGKEVEEDLAPPTAPPSPTSAPTAESSLRPVRLPGTANPEGRNSGGDGSNNSTTDGFSNGFSNNTMAEAAQESEGSLELHHLAFHYSTTARWNLPERDELELHRITQELLSELFKEEYPDQIGFVDVLSSSRLARRVFMFDVLVHFKNSYQMPSIAQVDTRVTNALQSGQPLNIKYLEMIRSMDSTIFETTISVHYISNKHALDELIIDQRDEGSSEDHNGEDEEEDQDEESSDSNTVASDNGDNYVSNFYETNSSESSSGDKPFDQVPNFFVSLLLFVAGLVVVLLLATLYYYCRIRRARTAPELERSDIEEHLETIKNKGISSYSTAAFSKDGIDNPEGLRASALAPYSVNRNKGGSRLPPPPPKNTELEEVSLLDDEHDGRPEQQSKGAKQQVSTQLTNPLSHNRRRTSEDQPGHFTGQRRIAAKQSTNPFNDSARPVDDQPQKLHEPQITHSTNPFSDNIKPVDYHRDPFNGKRTNDRPNKQRARTKQSTNQLRDNRNFLDTQPSTCSDKPGTLVKWSTNPFDDNERSYDDQPHPQQCSGTGTSVQKSLAQLDAVAREQKIRDELSVSSSLSESRASFFDSSLKAEQANPQQRIVVDSVPPPSPQSQFASPPVHTHEPKDMDDEEDFDSLPSVKDRMAMLSASMSLKGTTEVGNEEVASVRSNSKIPLVVNVQSSQTVVSKSSDRSVSYHNNKIYGGSPVQEVSSRSSTSSRARRRGSGQAPGAPKPVVPRRPRSPPPKQNTSLPSKEQESVPEWMRKFNEMGLAKGED